MPTRSASRVTGVGLALAGVSTVAELLRAGDPRAAAPVEPGARIGHRGLRYSDRATQLALAAARDALADAGLIPDDAQRADPGTLTVDGAGVAVVASSNLGNLDTVCETSAAIAGASTDVISPMSLPNASSNVVASAVATRFALRGPNLMLCNGPTSGLDAVHWGAALIGAGRCSRALVVGVEPRNPVVSQLTGIPQDELFDGAVALLLEDATHAAARGVRPLAEIGDYAREADLAACLADMGQATTDPWGVWFAEDPAAAAAGRPSGSGLAGAPRYAFSDVHGHSSGALGVLQCAAAIGWFTSGGTAPALITTGGDGADAVAALALRPAAGTRS
ncbi:beta-ketoacyl synthase [Streptomyces sp. APSN-46.1]|uniref:beta-ketoacyl synthase N-terminal-like domain-containing protein n=1 Tax=Streptomyces sp. APSN-46.1 TaxID=2929049 RepID=UPI001FB3B595|nr:beta-ketoacyl synthase N-terminal-like domain-containing protein [Streptomyces sp. APSN-46.1]MCJ1680076.1 beta-ketoacyl synthase [Streptomyces sp. APSN-46.1]